MTELRNSPYRPLPDGLYIADSVIDGQGVHTRILIPADTNLGLARIESVSGRALSRTPLGGFLNHSVTPNCFVTEPARLSGECDLVTLADVPAGTELTVKYRLAEYGGLL